jgi:hypothetical protein
MDTEVKGFSLTQHCTAHRHPTHVQHTTQNGSPLKGVKIQRKEGITKSLFALNFAYYRSMVVFYFEAL